MIATCLRVEIVPLLVVNRRSHFLWIPMIHTFVTPIIFLAPVILRVINVWIVIEAVPIVLAICATPTLTVRAFLSVDITTNAST